MIFRKIKKSCNTKTLWKQNRNVKVFVCLNQKYTYNATSESMIKSVKMIKIMEMISLERRLETVLGVFCGELNFVRVWRFAQRFENQSIMTKHIKKQEKTQNKTWKKTQNHDFYRIFVRAITLWKHFCSTKKLKTVNVLNIFGKINVLASPMQGDFTFPKKSKTII